MKTVIRGGRVITPRGMLDGHAVILSGGKIGAILPDGAVTDGMLEGAALADATGLYVSPGFIDLHVHGGGGRDVMERDPQAVIAMADAHAARGTTGIVPTTVAAPLERLRGAAAAVAAARKTRAQILGIHFEGPFLSAGQCGAQNTACLLTPQPAAYEPLLNETEHLLMMGAAPELPGGLALGRAIRRRGAVASIAHSDATYAQVCQAVDSGYSDVTHLYSGCSMLKRVNSYRIAGVVESAFLLDALSVGIIADGRHLPAELLRLICRVKSPQSICLMTDGLRFSAADIAEGQTYRMEDGRSVVMEDGVMKMPDRQSFAGSVATMNALVRTMTRLAGVPLDQAVAMAAQNPARVLGLDGKKGALSAGMDADVVIFDGDVEVKGVWIGGARQETRER